MDLFLNGGKIRPKIKNQYVARYSQDTSFTELSDLEAYACLNEPRCIATNPRIDSNKAKCQIKAIYNISQGNDINFDQSCPYEKISGDLEPFFMSIGETVFYSVVKKTTTTTTCQHGIHIIDKNPTLIDVGKFQLPGLCKVYLNTYISLSYFYVDQATPIFEVLYRNIFKMSQRTFLSRSLLGASRSYFFAFFSFF